jgi:large subunit ribosomal protein L18
MKQGPRYYIKQRRRREGITDYRKRLKLLKSRKNRIVVRNSLKNIRVQFIKYESSGDKIIASAISSELTNKYNWKYSTSTTSAAYLTGILAGKRALDKGIKEGVFDIGRRNPVKGSKIFASLKGVIDAGIKCPHSSDKIPDENRIMGHHLDNKIESQINNIKNKIIGD